jgi:hypothetical protein
MKHARDATEVNTRFWWGTWKIDSTWKNDLVRDDDIKIGFQEISWKGLDWVGLTQDLQMESCCGHSIDSWVPLKYLEFLGYLKK